MPGLVSICIPVYNGERFIEQAVRSAAEQTWSDKEIICVDNQSSDATWEILTRLSTELPGIQLHRNDHTVSMYDNFNRTLDFASGDCIKFLCADDVMYPRCLEAMMRLFERDRGLGLVTCRDHRIDEDGKTLRSTHPFNRDRIMAGQRILKKMIRGVTGTYTKTPTHVMYRRRGGEADKFPLINDNGWGNDTCKWMEILISSKYGFVNEDLVGNREHGQSFSASEARTDHAMTMQSYYNFFARFINDHRHVVSKLDLYLFKRTFRHRLKEHGLSVTDLDDWATLF